MDGFIATMATYIIFRYFFFFPSVFDFDFRAGGPFFLNLVFSGCPCLFLSLSLLRHGLTAVKATSIYLSALGRRDFLRVFSLQAREVGIARLQGSL